MGRDFPLPTRRFGALLALVALGMALTFATSASASKQVVDYFGTEAANVSGEKGGEFKFPGAIAVNQGGAGPAEAGEIYVVDQFNNRIERFSRDDNGTPTEGFDDSYHFISAWGTDVVSAGGTGDVGNEAAKDYEICTVAEQCKAGVPASGNGTALGNGDLGSRPGGITVDQDTGYVYVTDSSNHRINVYEGNGTFLRSFGYDVAESGPDDLPGAAEQQKVTVKASGGKFSLLFRGQTTGATARGRVIKNSNLVTKVLEVKGAFSVGQGFSAFEANPGLEGAPPELSSVVPHGTTITAIGEGTLTLSKAALADAPGNGKGGLLFADNLPFNASSAAVEASLNALSTIGGAGGSVTVSRTEKSPEEFTYTIDFGGSLSGTDLPALIPSKGGLTIGAGEPSVTVEESARGGAYETCVGAAGDVCRAGGAGTGAGELGVNQRTLGEATVDVGPMGLAVSQPDGNPADGRVFVADPGNYRVVTYNLDGSSPSSFGSAAVFDCGCPRPSAVAVDSRGIVYANNQKNNNEIERYDTENADGEGVGFLAPIAAGIDEQQQVTIAASAGAFKLCFEGPCTGDLAFNATAEQVRKGLEALPSLGPENVSVSGGPGGSQPYKVTFFEGHGAEDVEPLLCESGSTPLSGGSGCSVSTTTPGQPGLIPTSDGFFGGSPALTVQPDRDGPGPEGDVLYVARFTAHDILVQQFGPLNPPGLSPPPAADDARHADRSSVRGEGTGLALDEASGRIYLTGEGGAGQSAHGVYILDNTGAPPTATLDSITDVTATAALVHATIDPNGPPALSYHLEYSTDGTTWKSMPSVLLGAQETPQEVEALLDPPGTSLEPETFYHVRLVAVRPFVTPVVTAEGTFTTLASPPEAETTGSPVRTATTARLEGRVNPRGTATTYRFEYGDEGPCDEFACEATEAKAAGSGSEVELVSQWVEGLQPNTIYHYRLIADNGNPGSPVFGEDMTTTTLASDTPFSHGHLPGPPGSDRDYELVSPADTSGHPVSTASGIAGDGERALYGVFGGIPASDIGSLQTLFLAERGTGGWQTRQISPPRSQLVGNRTTLSGASGNLSAALIEDKDFTTQAGAAWLLSPSASPQKLFETAGGQLLGAAGASGLSADGSRAVLSMKGGALDPSHPAATSQENIYDINTGSPKLLSLLPGNVLAACGTAPAEQLPPFYSAWVSADGSRVFFASQGSTCGGDEQLYMREVEAEQTKLISGPPLSGLQCGAVFLRSTPGAAFLWTQSRLSAEDTAPAKCSGEESTALNGDVYRYDFADDSLKCVTCAVVGLAANVPDQLTGIQSGKNRYIAVSEDGSRVYFDAKARLLPGTPASGLYRVEVATGALAYVGPEAELRPSVARAMSPDGAVIVFRSADPALDPLGGTTNAGTPQDYRYDDRDRSLVCVSCPPHGPAPVGPVPLDLVTPKGDGGSLLSADGEDFAFTTPTPLVNADQNTAGAGQEAEAGDDVYEWRDGRPLLVTDGLASWVARSAPEPEGIGRSGRDLFFTAAARYTADALDATVRLYDARIGGGFEFPVPPKPCPLEVCQGTPKGAPEEQEPASANFSGAGNNQPQAKHKKRHHKRKRHRHRRANAKGRTHR